MSGSSAQLWHCKQRLCTVVRTDAGLTESFEVKVGLHQGSLLNPLLFAAVMDVISSDTRSGLPSELLYADDLVIMAPTMEKPGRRVADWRASLHGKGMKMESGPVASVGKEYKLCSVHSMYKMDPQTVQWCGW